MAVTESSVIKTPRFVTVVSFVTCKFHIDIVLSRDAVTKYSESKLHEQAHIILEWDPVCFADLDNSSNEQSKNVSFIYSDKSLPSDSALMKTDQVRSLETLSKYLSLGENSNCVTVNAWAFIVCLTSQDLVSQINITA